MAVVNPVQSRRIAADVVGRLRAAGCVFAEEEARLLVDAAGDEDRLRGLVARRVAGEPLEHVLGWVEFCGLRVTVDPGVFVPRRRTELLVRTAVRLMPDAPGIVVDLCCGAGAVAVAIAVSRGDWEIHAVDVDPVAAACAGRNLTEVTPAHQVYCGDLYAPLPTRLRGAVDVIVANAPYVPTGQIAFMPVDAREHEPAAALDGGSDGVQVHRRIAAEAPRWLTPGGRLLIETSEPLAERTAAVATDAGLRASVVREDGAAVLVATR